MVKNFLINFSCLQLLDYKNLLIFAKYLLAEILHVALGIFKNMKEIILRG